ncbi:MAG: hypothetical protein N4A33_01080 [Bacteriovoracaceae bacterium]|jgi:nucleoside-diphosphate-sugar epimerase|nr:hypothetical protein [Bacteriovoracaceae bacterium]
MIISIISLGWLGLALYEELKDFYDVRGSYHFTKKNIKKEFFFDVNKTYVPRQVLDSNIIIINLPPSKISSPVNFLNFLKKIKDKKIIFISSIAICENKGVFNEQTVLNPIGKRACRIKELEDVVTSIIENNIIIRAAGLIGEGRNPAKILSGKKQVENGNVNLIERSDLIYIIKQALDEENIRLIHAVNQNHPLKSDYYNSICKKLGIEQIDFKQNIKTSEKIVETIHEKYQVTSSL